MPYLRARSRHRGFSFIELLVTAALLSLVFGSLLLSVQFAIKLIANSKVKAGAIALATEQIEYIRSLPYASVGTAGGIPDGPIPQESTTTLNGVTYHKRVLIEYVDSPDDGLGGADTNGILADYKTVKVEFSWLVQGSTSTIFLLTNVVPVGIESTDGGGTIVVNVFNEAVLPVSGASVRVYNDTTTTTIDVTKNTNIDGVALFAGAPAAANYQITVTKAGYGVDQTYVATTTNPNPVTPPVAVVDAAVSTMNFQIDLLADLLVRTVGPSTDGVFSDTFSDTANIADMTDTVLSGGSVVLAGGAGSYLPSGTVHSTGTTPGTITAWDTAEWSATVPGSTALTVQVFSVDAFGAFTLISDTDIPGNSAGFSGGPVSLVGVDPGTYPTLALGATLTSSDVNATPSLEDWSIGHIITEPSIASIPFTLTGAKVIGAGPVYKYNENHTTNGSGEIALTNLESDLYTLILTTGAYDVSEACANIPYALLPGANDTLTLTLVPSTVRSLRVSVQDISGNPITGADVTLSRPGFNETLTTSTCGQVFFNSGLSENDDYEVDVTAAGYTNQTITPVDIDGTHTLTVTMST